MSGQRILLTAALLVFSAFGESGRAAENAHPAFAKTCGRSTMIVRCSEASPSCERNELVLRAGTSQPFVLPAPQGLEKYDPVGCRACAARKRAHSLLLDTVMRRIAALRASGIIFTPRMGGC